VQDAVRHGVDVRSVDVTVSDWDCTLEPTEKKDVSGAAGATTWPAHGRRAIGSRRATDRRRTTNGAVRECRRSAHRAGLDRRDLSRLAEADALAALAGHRHEAAWDVAGVERLPPLLSGSTFAEADAGLSPPTEGQDIVADYRALSLTLRRHPLSLLRGKLKQRRLATAAEIAQTPHGRIVRTAGIVIGRQRPDTASGVVFVTLEDETAPPT
jgi:error-prone DNA polymerase